jgi:hypothetical protein
MTLESYVHFQETKSQIPISKKINQISEKKKKKKKKKSNKKGKAVPPGP